MLAQEQIGNIKLRSETRSIITTGLALFSMFFGAGNLIFPLLIGQGMGKNVWFSILGLGITAVVVPFLGLAAMVLFNANTEKFFNRIGKVPGFLLFLLIQMILGSFGVIPRLIILMHAIAKPFLFDLSLPAFSVWICSFIFLVSFKRDRLIGLLGSVLTPILILSLMALIGIGLTSHAIVSSNHICAFQAFMKGFLGGYHTMDLMAAFLFATIVLPHFQEESNISDHALRKALLLRKMFYSSLIAAFLLFFTYVGLSLVAAYHGASLVGSIQPEEMLSAIAFKLLGSHGGTIAAVAVITACLTTAVTLSAIFAQFIQKDISNYKISKGLSLVITLIIAASFANLGFKGISKILGPILEITYPSLIVLSVFNFLNQTVGTKSVKIPVFLTLAISAFVYFK